MPGAHRHFERFKKAPPDRPRKRQANHEAERGRRAGMHIQKPEKIVRKKNAHSRLAPLQFSSRGAFVLSVIIGGGINPVPNPTNFTFPSASATK